MKAAMYGRVSSEEQVDNFSISAQINAINEYCIKNNIELFDSYIDEGISGTKEDRPEFQRMIKDAEKGLFNVILVHKFDRFARKVEISQRIKSRLKKANVNVVSITEPIEDSPIGFFQEGLLELLSEYYVKNLSNEVKKGKRERALRGLNNGCVPYGYKTENGIVSIVEDEANVVRIVFDMYLNGNGYNKIAAHLNINHIKSKNGCLWQHNTINRMIDNPFYAGWIKYNGKLYESKIPPIVDKDIYETAKREKGVKGVRYTYKTSRQDIYLFLGLLKCGECGWNMRIQYSTKHKYKHYVCNNAAKNVNLATCSFKKYIPLKIEQKILEQLTLETEYDTDIVAQSQTTINDIYDTRKDRINKELQRAKDAYMAGIFTLDEYSKIRIKLENELKDLEKTIIPCPNNDKKNKIQETLKKIDEIEPDNIIERKKLLKSIIRSISIKKIDDKYLIKITYL